MPLRGRNTNTTMITITTGYHNDQEIHFVETSIPRIYKRTKDDVQSSYLGSITTSDKWLVTYDDRKRVFKTRKAALEFLSKVS